MRRNPDLKIAKQKMPLNPLNVDSGQKHFLDWKDYTSALCDIEKIIFKMLFKIFKHR